MISLKNYFSSQDKNIQYELVNLLYSQAGAGILASFFVASFLTLALYHVMPNGLLFGWYGAVTLITLFRYSMVKIYLHVKPTAEQWFFWYKLFIFIATLGGIIWACSGTILMPEDGMHRTLIACVLAGVSACAVPYFSGSRLACAMYTAPMLLPFATWLFMQGSQSYYLLGIFTVCYFAVLIFSSFKTHKVIYNAIKLKFQNSSLIKDLTRAHHEMDHINRDLKNEIGDRKLAEKLLRESEEQYRLVTDALPVLISYIDLDFNFRFNNKAHEVWFGKPLTEITGQPIKNVLGNTAYSIFIEHYEKINNQKQIHYETVMQFRDDEERYVSVTLIPHVHDNKVTGLFSLISDMTPRINYLATHDALTDLPNRSLFTARFSQALKRANRHHYQVALLFLDLDHFKNINDTLGHDIGDHLLVKVVERIKSCLRGIDILARLGGDEFTIILEDITTENVIGIANKICQSFTQPFLLNDHNVFITTSMGISIYPEDGKDMQVLLKNADMAIYRAKECGRNTFEFYTDELNDKVVKKHTIETNLRTALEKQEFLLYYQPIVDIRENTVSGLESLIRWQQPEIGLIAPGEFIPIAEEVGLIVPIGEWIFRTACMQKISWHQKGYLPLHVPTAINISARQFREKNLIDMISAILKETGLSGEYLSFELTETLIMQDIEYSNKMIKAFKDLGITISVDDFGTGYSSLNYLRKFPIDILKIDRSFISDITINSDDASIVAAIIAMAHSLKMKVIAEGVEKIEQYLALKERDCDGIQGFLISKPQPAADTINLLQNPNILEKLLSQQPA